jgi:hypothetical protein
VNRSNRHFGIGVSHPAIAAGFTPLTNPPNAKVEGWYGPTKLMSPEG